MPEEQKEFEVPDQPPDLSEPEPEAAKSESNEVEEIAKSMGWNPNFDGEGAKTAKEFILHGQEMLKTSSKHAKSIARKLERVEQKQEEMAGNLEKHFRNLHKATKAKYEAQIADLEAKMEAAVEEGDTDEFRKVRKELKNVEKQAAKEGEPEKKSDEPADPVWQQEYETWLDDNDWYNVDAEMTETANKIHREHSAALTPKRFFNFLNKQIKEYYPEKFEKKAPKTPKTVAGPTSTARGTKGVPKLSDLTPDQRRLVREGCDATGMKPEQYMKDLMEIGALEG